MRIRVRARRLWRNLRYEDFYVSIQVAPPPLNGDATALLQAAINEAHHSQPGAYEAALQRYESRRLRFLHREPLLHRQVQISSGTYNVSRSLMMHNITIRGDGK